MYNHIQDQLWRKMLSGKGKQNHPTETMARFFDVGNLTNMIGKALLYSRALGGLICVCCSKVAPLDCSRWN